MQVETEEIILDENGNPIVKPKMPATTQETLENGGSEAGKAAENGKPEEKKARKPVEQAVRLEDL